VWQISQPKQSGGEALCDTKTVAIPAVKAIHIYFTDTHTLA
jgi:hypothetical protein